MSNSMFRYKGSNCGTRVRAGLAFTLLYVHDTERFLYLLIPCGLVPAAAMLLTRNQDRYTRVLTLVIIGYFGFFYIRAFVALHHFAPAMILPTIVLWRILLQRKHRPIVTGSTIVIAAICLWLSFPRSFAIDRTFRDIGQVTDYQAGDYNGS